MRYTHATAIDVDKISRSAAATVSVDVPQWQSVR